MEITQSGKDEALCVHTCVYTCPTRAERSPELRNESPPVEPKHLQPLRLTSVPWK